MSPIKSMLRVKRLNHGAYTAVGSAVVFGSIAAFAQGDMVEPTLLGILQTCALAASFAIAVLTVEQLNHRAATFFAALVCAFLIFDARLYAVMGVHFYSPVTLSSLSSIAFIREVNLAPAAWASAMAMLIACFFAIAGLQWCSKRLAEAMPMPQANVQALVLLMVVAGIGYGAANWEYRRLSHDDRSRIGDALPFFSLMHEISTPLRPLHLTYPDTYALDIPKAKNILMILVESLRSDAFTAESMPLTYRFAKEQGCFVSPRHFANSQTTIFGAFAFWTGMSPHHLHAMREKSQPPLPLQLLRQNGYRLLGASASQLRGWQGAEYMLTPFNEYREFDSDDAMLSALPKFFESNVGPYAHFVFFVSTHWNYTYPAAYKIYTPVAPSNINPFAKSLQSKKVRQGIRNRYRNATRYVDDGINRVLLHHADDIAAGRLAVVIAGDHGEEFWEHGVHGHNATQFFNEVVRTPLVMCLPDARIENVTLTSHTDIMPTLFGYMAVPEATRLELFDGVSLLSPAAKDQDRSIIITGAGFPDESRKMALVTDDGKFMYEIVTPGLNGLIFRKALSHADGPMAEKTRPSVMHIGKRLSRYLTL